MDITLLVQMRQCNKFGSVRNDKIINLNLGSGVGLESAPLPPTRHQPDLLFPSGQTINQEKNRESRNDILLPTNHVVLHWPMYTERRIN